jgi:thiol-disulfide isomerase/thioredoxin
MVFWATWCGNCHDDIIFINKIKKEFKTKGCEIIALSEDYKDIKIIGDYFVENDINNLEIYYDHDNFIMKKLQISGLPTAILVDSRGNIIKKISGSLKRQQETIRSAITEQHMKK